MNMLYFTKFWGQQLASTTLLDRSSCRCQLRVKSWVRSLQLTTTGLLLAIGTSSYFPNVKVDAAIFDRSGRKIPDREVNSERVNWQMLSATTGQKYNGVGSIDVDYGVCTGFFISTGNNPQAPAYVLTNGHCQGLLSELPNQNEVRLNRPSKTVFIVNYFHDFRAKRMTIPVKQMVYGTMKDNDIAILELTKTYQEMLQAGISPLTLSDRPVSKGEPTLVVGIPSQGVKEKLSFLHAATCQTGELVNLKEDIYNWKKSIRHNCSIVGGMSGSPMISLKTNRVIGIINTGVNDSAAKQPQCSLNRPCEISPNGTVQTFDRENYGQLVDRIPSCFDRNGRFEILQPTCQLERP
jgi:Trypsin-like peptidase domain